MFAFLFLTFLFFFFSFLSVWLDFVPLVCVSVILFPFLLSSICLDFVSLVCVSVILFPFLLSSICLDFVPLVCVSVILSFLCPSSFCLDFVSLVCVSVILSFLCPSSLMLPSCWCCYHSLSYTSFVRLPPSSPLGCAFFVLFHLLLFQCMHASTLKRQIHDCLHRVLLAISHCAFHDVLSSEVFGLWQPAVRSAVREYCRGKTFANITAPCPGVTQ